MKRSMTTLLMVLAYVAILAPEATAAQWLPSGSTISARSRHTATLLPSGRILVAGGHDGSGALASAELYDPATGTWQPTGSLAAARLQHTATLLPSGKVLVAGGIGHAGPPAGGELYDPTTGTWQATGALATPRYRHSATLLPSGKVLVVGGAGGSGQVAATELYDPTNGTWEAGGALAQQRYDHTATLLPSGKVLVVGGYGSGDSLAGAELYDPDTGNWATVGSLSQARNAHTATVLPSGKVIVVGGYDGGYLSSAELYDPETQTWQVVGELIAARKNHTATLLPSGKLLVVAGEGVGGSLSEGELYNPATDSWTTVGALAESRHYHTATLLPSGEPLVVGGIAGSGIVGVTLSGVESFDPAGGGWQGTEQLAAARSGFTTTVLPSGKVLVVGGHNQGGSLSGVELYDPATGSWSPAAPLATARYAHTATLLVSGEVLVVGGHGDAAAVSGAELYDPATDSWTATGSSILGPRYGHTATLLAAGEVLVVGGHDGESSLATAEIYDPATDTWAMTAPLTTARRFQTATVLPSGMVLVAGGLLEDSTILSSAEVYDPRAGAWTVTAPLAKSRYQHTATLLPSGKVLVAGGYSGNASARAELYDPVSGTWEPTGSLNSPRFKHTAVLLASGKVLVAGGWDTSALSEAELYHPATGEWTTTGSLTTKRSEHATVTLASGDVLAVGGFTGGNSYVSSAELYDESDELEGRRPVISPVSPTTIQYGGETDLEGWGFGGDSEASSGTTTSSAVNYPLVRLQSLSDGELSWLIPDPRPNFWDDPMTLTIRKLPPLKPGPHLLSVVTAGVPSRSEIVEVECGLVIDEHPVDAIAAIGSSVTFTVATQGGRRFQWQKDGIDIPGANGPTYTTPPITAADAATVYRVAVDSGCTTMESNSATLTVADDEPPVAAVLSPNGGEYWSLSEAGDVPNTEIVSWSMSDNVRICSVNVSLVYSNDGGVTYLEAPAGGGLPATFGSETTCPNPGESTTSMEFTVPTEPPSGTVGSLYKLRVHVTDHAGNVTVAASPNAFFIVQSNSSATKTLILTNLPRMQALMGISAGEVDALAVKLQDLAAHPSVQGLVLNLDGVTALEALYAAWDADTADTVKANEVLFAADGIHDYLLELLDLYSDIEYLMLVGDDRIIPMARLRDYTTGLHESDYTSDDPSDLNAGLTPGGTTVGQALAADRFLSDDPLATFAAIRPAHLDTGNMVFIPDLAVGRLVEEPVEIIAAIATFISQDGAVDLSPLDPVSGHKVLVTAYDFLFDSGANIRRRWKNAFGLSEPHDDQALSPVDGQLLSENEKWGLPTVDDRSLALHTHLAGNGGERYAVMSLNGHATHFEAGIPGITQLDIVGLNAVDIYGEDDCATPGLDSVDLAGGVVYAVGCHGGLSVPGKCATDGEHSLDLPQTLLARGVMAYVANSGYGWGLLHGVGYSERMVEILTEEMTAGATVVMGDAVKYTKLRYYLESPRFDSYDAKTLMQWTFYGFPMYKVNTGLPVKATRPFAASPPEREDLSSVKQLGPVTVESLYADRTAAGGKSLPSYLTRLELHFDVTAPGVYTKHSAAGDALDDTPGCPVQDGCYYRLNGLATGETDLPIQPYLVFDSRLSGTSQHGVLWMGADYSKETDWTPVFARLASNVANPSQDLLGMPRTMLIRPGHPGRRSTGDLGQECRPSDLDLSSVVTTTGELLKASDSDPDYTIQRLHREVDLEVFYFNNTSDAVANCDRTGPLFDQGPYHEVTGATIDWMVPVSDEAGVWRVVVVYDDEDQDRWIPLELADDGTGTWRGSMHVSSGMERLTYTLQAVDMRGNVSWLEYESPVPLASGVPLGIVLPIDAYLDPGQADVTVALTHAPDPVLAGDPLTYTIVVTNLGPDPADSVSVSVNLPAGVGYQLAGGTGWSCGESADVVTCSRDTVEVGTASPINIFVTAPAAGGWLTGTVTVSAGNDPTPDNDTATVETLVIDESMTDLAVVKEDGGAPAMPGESIIYSIAVRNQGPNPVVGAVVTDVFPPELTAPVWDCVATVGSSCTASGSGDIVDPVDLLPNGMLLYTAVAMVAPDAAAAIANTATVTLPASMRDVAPGNDSSTVITAISASDAVIFADGFESGGLSAWSTGGSAKTGQ